ncbi:MAG: STAS domain-containing protein [Clostridiales bacterium]|nr:STAS domain-containing protein [Clostridiales bacterium]
MNIAHEKFGAIDLIKLKGKLNNASKKKFAQSIEKYVVQNCHIILDMSACDFISNVGFRYLVLLDREILSKWGKFVIVGLSDEIVETMNLTGFENVFSIYSSVYEVLDDWKVGGKYAKNR